VSASQLSQWSALMVLVALTFHLLTLKLVCQSHQRCGTFILNFGTLGLLVLELFGMYATNGRTDRQTDRWTDKSNPSYGRGHNNRSYIIYGWSRFQWPSV